MQERIKEIPTRIMEFWKKYSSKQKTIIIAVICAVLVAIAVVAYLVSRPTWTKFQEFSKLDDANKMASALDDAGIDQLERAAAELAHIDDNEAAQNAHLRRGDGRPVGGGVQRLQHIVQQLANSVVHLRHLAAGTL